jgi:hypothetical protein
MASAPAVVSTPNAPTTFPLEAGVRRARRLSKAEVLWLVFVSVQALDGAMSYIGVTLHGPAIEANPLVAWYMGAFGPAVGFTAAKLFAVMCGAVLYVTARHKWVAVLTLLYLVFAVGPWASILAISQ